MAPSRIRSRCLAALVAVALVAPAGSQPSLTEPQAKAGLVLNFGRYVEWPPSAFASREAPVVACVLGRDSVGPALAALESRPVQGRTLKVRIGLTPDELRGCRVVFIGETEERRAQPALRAVAGQPVLTVGDAERFIETGGAIGIVRGEDRLQFEVSRAALEAAQLKASSNLLRLARNLP